MSKATIIFDFDGTLANSLDLVLSLYNEHADEFGYEPMEKGEFPELRRLGYRKAMKKKGIKLIMLPKIVPKLSREMRARMGEVDPYEGITDMLAKLRDQGYSIGVLTSNQAPLVEEFFAKHEFPPFDFVVSEKTLFSKEKALRKILKNHGLRPQDVVYVGDEPRDVSASRKAKVKVVGVTWGLGGEEGFGKKSPDRLVSTVPQLHDAITELTSA